MKITFFAASLLIIALVSCSPVKKAYQNNDYEKVMFVLTDKAQEGRASVKDLNMLANSYHKANETDFARIMELKKTAQPDIWAEIYWRTYNIGERNNMIAKLNTQQKEFIGYKPIDVSSELASSKNKAEAYLSKKAETLLNTNNKNDAEQAIKLLRELGRINNENASLGELYPKAIVKSAGGARMVCTKTPSLRKYKGMANSIEGDNGSSDSELTINISVSSVEVSPERHDKVSFEEKNNGKTAKVTDNTLTKSANIKGDVSITDQHKNELYRTSFEVSSTFKYNFTTIEGDRAACSEQSLRMSDRKAIPFPSDASIANDAGKQLNKIIKEKFGMD